MHEDISFKNPNSLEYVPLKSKNGQFFAVLEFIVEKARDYGWTSGLFDENLADAIEKARNADEDPYGCQYSLTVSEMTYQAMEFARHPYLVDAKAVRRLETPDDLEL